MTYWTETAEYADADELPQMRQMHIMLQKKSGAGKSFISAMMCDYMTRRGIEYQAFDLDHVHYNMNKIKSLNAKKVKGQGDQAYDMLVEDIIEAPTDKIIIDAAAASYQNINRYILRNDVIAQISDYDIQTTIHCVIRGGKSLYDCLKNMADVIKDYNSEDIWVVVWLNEVEGRIEHKGKYFENMKVYDDNKTRINQIVVLPEEPSDLVKADIAVMKSLHRTTDEAIRAKDTSILSKLRYRQLQEKYDALVAQVI